MASSLRFQTFRGIKWSQELKLIVFMTYRKKHKNSWCNVKSATDLEVKCGNDIMKFSSGKMARFADGAAVVQLGQSSVLVTAVSHHVNQDAKQQSFLPLTVDFRQKAAAGGRIPTNYLRRETGPSEQEILTSRVIDRSIRPLFPDGYASSTQVICNLLAVDGVHDPSVISINAASAALAVSDIPWNGPVGAVRVGMVDKQVVINPTRKQLQASCMDIIVCGAAGGKVVMLEGEADRVPINDVQQALSKGVKATQGIIRAISDMQAAIGKVKREMPKKEEVPSHIIQAVHSSINFLRDILFKDEHDKFSRDKAIKKVKEQVISNFKESFPDEYNVESMVGSYFDNYVKQVLRDLILDEERRCDGRDLTEMRDISCEVDLYKPLHGSALFQRGQTQVLCAVTFDSIESAIKADPISQITGGYTGKNFMLHYEFPPYATNETGKFFRGGRRELGHGNLAERGLKPILPDQKDFTIRLTSEVLESNGSSSMASVCGGSLALMDAGVKVKEAAAGVAMGMVSRSNEQGTVTDYKILTDLLGIEDYMGDMDFKMAATEKGLLTAIQCDVKLPGVPFYAIDKALIGGFDAIKRITTIMNNTLSAPRTSMKPCGPVIEKLELDQVKQKSLVGMGGFNVRRIKSETGVSISRIDENIFSVFAPNPEAMAEAKELIESLMESEKEPILEMGSIYTVRITEMREYGVMVEIHKSITPILLHNSQLDMRRVSHPSALGLNVGDEIQVKYFGRDPASGQHRLSRKVLQTTVPRIRDLNTKI